ncbi:hypothetical protein TNCV_1504251 [Trichonephila clavipes]|uniref:Partial AB-hydrolase lipase domain-containing protein n=1 Tax=Trichonephila clavipes TaxID=2585209 RepID=A0A8X6VAC3_TRICX|nr:hypothetical protein TNCV_1504251 [Trichonephila clavipes]
MWVYLLLAVVPLAAADWYERRVMMDPDIQRNVSQLISSKGYPVEEHEVQTKDGFLLALQRIPYGRKAPGDYRGSKMPVFLQHGLLSAASDFVINFPDQSLGFLLADSGYDVWLGNTRGNTYSRRHTKLRPNTDAFWDFSFDEMGAYDLPAMIDHVLNVTHQDRLAYIGHSQGTTAAFALLSENPEYNKKVKVFIALAPVASGIHITNVVSYLAPFSRDLAFLAKLFGIRDFLPNNKIMKWLSEYLCAEFEKFICENAMFLFFGRDYQELNVIPTQLACAYLKGHLARRALDWFEVLGYRVVEDKATDYAHLKQALTEQFPVVRNTSELETRFFASSQKHNQQPSDFVYDLLKIHKILKLEMTEGKLIDHIISRLETQILDYVEHPQTTSNLLQIIDKYEERFLNRKIRGSSWEFRDTNPSDNNRFPNMNRQENWRKTRGNNRYSDNSRPRGEFNRFESQAHGFKIRGTLLKNSITLSS